MRITGVRPEEFGRLLEIWEASVRATHDFLREEDIRFIKTRLPEYFAAVELFAARDDYGGVHGFMGMSSPQKIEMLFMDPPSQGKGLGRAFIRYALERSPLLEVDVNEQNPAARIFYEKCGFRQTGRSPLDGEGKPFPILHLKRR